MKYAEQEWYREVFKERDAVRLQLAGSPQGSLSRCVVLQYLLSKSSLRTSVAQYWFRKKKKKKAFHWLNRLSTPSSKAQHFLGCSIKEEIHSTFCARCVGAPSKGHNHKPGGFLWCFPDQGHPTREVPGLLCHCCTSLGLFWCRRGEEASGLFLGRALTLRCPPSSENSPWHPAQLILPPLAFEEERPLWRWLVDGKGGLFCSLPCRLLLQFSHNNRVFGKWASGWVTGISSE